MGSAVPVHVIFLCHGNCVLFQPLPRDCLMFQIVKKVVTVSTVRRHAVIAVVCVVEWTACAEEDVNSGMGSAGAKQKSVIIALGV